MSLYPKWFLDLNAKRKYDIPVLSGSAYIGQLYDARTDQLIYDRYLWKDPVAFKEANITSVETNTYIEENVKNRMDHLSISADVSMSLQYGLIKVRFIYLILWNFAS